MADGSTDLDSLSAQAAPKSAPPDIARMLSQIQGMEGKSEKEQSDIDKQTEASMAKDRAAMEKHASAEEDIMRTVEPWKQNMPEADPLAQFGSLGSVFGLLASAFTHQPMINGMNAAAAAINAARANDLAAYKDAYNTWKENTNLALKRQDMEHKEYQDAHQAMMDDFNMGQSKLRTAIAKYGSPYDHLSFEAGEYDKIFERSLKQQEISLKLQDAMPELVAKGDIVQAQMALKNAQVAGDLEGIERAKEKLTGALQSYADLRSSMTGFKPGSMSDPMQVEVQNPDGTKKKVMAVFDKENSIWVSADGKRTPIPNVINASKVSSSAPGDVDFTPADKQFWANVLKNGGSLPPGLSRTRSGSELVQQVMKEVPGLSGSAGEFIAAKSTQQADSRSLANMTKMTDAAVSFESTASKNFDLALKLGATAIPTDWGPWLNRWVEQGETMFGDKEVPAYVTAMLTGANEYAKIMSGSTGAQGSTVDSRKEAATLFSPYLSQGQIQAVIAVAKNDMNNRKSALQEQINTIKERITGEPTAPKTFGPTPSSASPPTSGPSEGTTSTSKSGKPIIFRNGQWEYK